MRNIKLIWRLRRVADGRGLLLIHTINRHGELATVVVTPPRGVDV